jgi:hypothetical protein
VPDSMTIRLHLRRLRVAEVVEDAIERLVVAVQDLRTCAAPTAGSSPPRCTSAVG